MNRRIKNAFGVIFTLGLVVCLFLSGCIQEELVITVNSDGSGEYTIIKYSGEMEEMAFAAVDGEAMPKMTEDQLAKELKSRSEGPVKCIGYNTVKNYNGKGNAEITKYSFDDLGQAVVVLENMVEISPRFKYQDGKFFVSVNREKMNMMVCPAMDPRMSSITNSLSIYPLSHHATNMEKLKATV